MTGLTKLIKINLFMVIQHGAMTSIANVPKTHHILPLFSLSMTNANPEHQATLLTVSYAGSIKIVAKTIHA